MPESQPESCAATATTRSAMRAERISVSYGARRVLERMSFELPAGSWTSIVGPNGCGKSTLLRTLGGLLVPRHGTVWLHDRPLAAWPRRERARRLAWLAQTVSPSELTALECVALGRLAHTGWLGSCAAADEVAIARAMAATGSARWTGRRLSTLSGGECRRVNLARVLAVEASVLLLDEPTAHLDPPHQEDIARLLRAQARERAVTIVSAIHDLSLALMADRLLVMGSGGALVGHGTVEEALAGEWLSRAFGTTITIVPHADAHLWSPNVAGPMVGRTC